MTTQIETGRFAQTSVIAGSAEASLNDLCRAIEQASGGLMCFATLSGRLAYAPMTESRAGADTPLAATLAGLNRDMLASVRADPRKMPAQRSWHVVVDGVPHDIEGWTVPDTLGDTLAALSLAFPEDGPRPAGCAALTPLVEHALRQTVGRLVAESELLTVQALCDKLHEKVQTEPLTGLRNSRAFRETAQDRLRRSTANQVLILADIDHFKRVNDLFGHRFGDEYLASIARAFDSALPEGALVGRLGGDEFGALVTLPSPGNRYLSTLLTQCTSAVQRAAAMLGKPDLGRLSLGAALYPDHAREFDGLFEVADAALYASKAFGRSTATVFRPGLHDRFNKGALDGRFRTAAAQNRIVPYFQPIVDLRSGQCHSYEVLMRWIDAAAGVLEPRQFAGVFGDHRLAETITRILLGAALDALADRIAARPQAGSALRLSLNLTAFDLMNPEFVFDLQTALTDRGLDWSSLVLEVTEKVMLDDGSGQIYRSLSELQTRGALLALDDFGTGYGGLKHLQNWPVDILKIDRHFVQHMVTGDKPDVVIEAILAISEKRGFAVVVEGVETPAQLAALRRLGCELGQGFLFDRPMPAARMREAPDLYDLNALAISGTA